MLLSALFRVILTLIKVSRFNLEHHFTLITVWSGAFIGALIQNSRWRYLIGVALGYLFFPNALTWLPTSHLINWCWLEHRLPICGIRDFSRRDFCRCHLRADESLFYPYPLFLSPTINASLIKHDLRCFSVLVPQSPFICTGAFMNQTRGCFLPTPHNNYERSCVLKLIWFLDFRDLLL